MSTSRISGYISTKLQTPIIASVIVGLIGGLMALVFDMIALVEMMSIGTLMAYTGVSASVLILRYQPWSVGYSVAELEPSSSGKSNINENSSLLETLATRKSMTLFQKLSFKRYTVPTLQSGRMAFASTGIFSILIIIVALFLINEADAVANGNIFACVFLTFLLMLILVNVLFFYYLPQNKSKLQFRVPMVPLWCLTSLALNLSIMMTLSLFSWVRVFVWLAIGLFVYAFYGVYKSLENRDSNYVDINEDVFEQLDDSSSFRNHEVIGSHRFSTIHEEDEMEDEEENTLLKYSDLEKAVNGSSFH